MVVESSGHFMYIQAPGQSVAVYSINPSTGAVTLMNSLSGIPLTMGDSVPDPMGRIFTQQMRRQRNPELSTPIRLIRRPAILRKSKDRHSAQEYPVAAKAWPYRGILFR